MSTKHEYTKSYLTKSVKVWYAAKEKYGADHEKTHRARGIVRGAATMYLIMGRPADRNNKIHVERIEQQFGMPGPAKGVYALTDTADTRYPDVEAAKARAYNDHTRRDPNDEAERERKYNEQRADATKTA